MVIDFSRLNSSSSLTGSTRTSVAKETAEAGQSAPLNTPAEQASTTQSGESVHLSNEAQQLQKVTDKLRDQPAVDKARVTVGWGRRKPGDQFGRKWTEPFLPA